MRRALFFAVVSVAVVTDARAGPPSNSPISTCFVSPQQPIDAQDEFGRSALYHAVKDGCEDTAAWLIEYGANPDARTEYPFDLFQPRLHGSSRWLQADNGTTALMIACQERKHSLVKLLLQAGANPNLQDRIGRTALMFAAENGDLPIIKALLDAGADITATAREPGKSGMDRSGSALRYALHWSLRNNDPSVASFILDRLKPGDLPNYEIDYWQGGMYGSRLDPNLRARVKALRGPWWNWW